MDFGARSNRKSLEELEAEANRCQAEYEGLAAELKDARQRRDEKREFRNCLETLLQVKKTVSGGHVQGKIDALSMLEDELSGLDDVFEQTGSSK